MKISECDFNLIYPAKSVQVEDKYAYLCFITFRKLTGKNYYELNSKAIHLCIN